MTLVDELLRRKRRQLSLRAPLLTFVASTLRRLVLH